MYIYHFCVFLLSSTRQLASPSTRPDSVVRSFASGKGPYRFLCNFERRRARESPALRLVISVLQLEMTIYTA